MPEPEKTSYGALGVASILGFLILPVWAASVATLANLAGSDAAGNALGQAYAAIEVIILWLLLFILAIVAAMKGTMPPPAKFAAFILIPVSGFVVMLALDLLSKLYIAPHLLPLVIPVLVPPLIVAFCFWALMPPMHARVPARLAGGIVWGAVLVLCLSIWPMSEMRESALDKESAIRAKYDADFASLPANSPLWDLTPFLSTRNDTKRTEVLERIRKLDKRQSEAELMLDRGDFPLLYLGSFDLDPTPALCGKARSLLRKRVEPLVLKSPNSKPYADIAGPVADAVAAMNWLVGYECSCDAESLAWESMAKNYRDTNFDVYRLAEIRDPKNLGRIVREHPERFSMLTPKAHLKAWLRFAEEINLREQALAGARKLDHRTADAVEMLRESDHEARTVMQYLPALDLAATPQLCAAGQKAIHDQLARVYRPRADDPRPYSELLDRLGLGEQLPALKWLASHGCDAEAELSEAETLVRSYQDSPARAAMLASLAQLRRKP